MLVKLCFSLNFIPLDPDPYSICGSGSDRIRVQIRIDITVDNYQCCQRARLPLKKMWKKLSAGRKKKKEEGLKNLNYPLKWASDSTACNHVCPCLQNPVHLVAPAVLAEPGRELDLPVKEAGHVLPGQDGVEEGGGGQEGPVHAGADGPLKGVALGQGVRRSGHQLHCLPLAPLRRLDCQG